MGLRFYNSFYTHFCKCFINGDMQCQDIYGSSRTINTGTAFCFYQFNSSSSSTYYASSAASHDPTRYAVPNAISDVTITGKATKNQISTTSPIGVECNLSIVMYNNSDEERAVSSIQFTQQAANYYFLVWAYYFDEDVVIPPKESRTVSITVNNKFFDM